jgi:hypothetical protein
MFGCPEGQPVLHHDTGGRFLWEGWKSGGFMTTKSNMRHPLFIPQGEKFTPSHGDNSAWVGSATPTPPRFLQSQKYGFPTRCDAWGEGGGCV